MEVEQVKLNLAAETLPDQTKILGYLEAGQILFIAAGMQVDELDPTRKFAVPIGFSTDGNYFWPLSLEYYMANHWIGITGPFLSHVRESNYQAPELSPERVNEVRLSIAKAPTSDLGAQEDLELINDHLLGRDPFKS